MIVELTPVKTPSKAACNPMPITPIPFASRLIDNDESLPGCSSWINTNLNSLPPESQIEQNDVNSIKSTNSEEGSNITLETSQTQQSPRISTPKEVKKGKTKSSQFTKRQTRNSPRNSKSGKNILKLVGKTQVSMEKIKPIKKKKIKMNWKRCEFKWEAELLDEPHSGGSDSELTPFQLFSSLFDEECIKLIVYQTNLYSVQKNSKSVNTNEKEIRAYLGIQYNF